jgi:DNA-binding IclR family transcriptional regulator
VRRRGWAHSLGQREPGVGSVSVPVRAGDGQVTAAVSISGPVERLARPSAEQRRHLQQAAARLVGT